MGFGYGISGLGRGLVSRVWAVCGLEVFRIFVQGPALRGGWRVLCFILYSRLCLFEGGWTCLVACTGAFDLCHLLSGVGCSVLKSCGVWGHGMSLVCHPGPISLSRLVIGCPLFVTGDRGFSRSALLGSKPSTLFVVPGYVE